MNFIIFLEFPGFCTSFSHCLASGEIRCFEMRKKRIFWRRNRSFIECELSFLKSTFPLSSMARSTVYTTPYHKYQNYLANQSLEVHISALITQSLHCKPLPITNSAFQSNFLHLAHYQKPHKLDSYFAESMVYIASL